jgi:hypothetical protein
MSVVKDTYDFSAIGKKNHANKYGNIFSNKYYSDSKSTLLRQ